MISVEDLYALYKKCTGITTDSRKIEEGVMFFALKGEKFDGNDFAEAALKAGMQVDRRELIALAERVLSGEVTHCPHGRPVMQVFTRAELDKRFGRIQ